MAETKQYAHPLNILSAISTQRLFNPASDLINAIDDSGLVDAQLNSLSIFRNLSITEEAKIATSYGNLMREFLDPLERDRDRNTDLYRLLSGERGRY